jgi:hypothetical protein
MSEANEALVRAAYAAGEDRNYLVLTLSGGQVVAMRAFRDRDEACAFTGLAGRLGEGGLA